MSNTIRELVQVMPLGDIIQIIHDWEQFERDGSIGESFLRETTEKYLAGFGSAAIVITMKDFALECYRFMAHFGPNGDLLKLQEALQTNESTT